jgi:hypothetical protein
MNALLERLNSDTDSQRRVTFQTALYTAQDCDALPKAAEENYKSAARVSYDDLLYYRVVPPNVRIIPKVDDARGPEFVMAQQVGEIMECFFPTVYLHNIARHIARTKDKADYNEDEEGPTVDLRADAIAAADARLAAARADRLSVDGTAAEPAAEAEVAAARAYRALLDNLPATRDASFRGAQELQQRPREMERFLSEIFDLAPEKIVEEIRRVKHLQLGGPVAPIGTENQLKASIARFYSALKAADLTPLPVARAGGVANARVNPNQSGRGLKTPFTQELFSHLSNEAGAALAPHADLLDALHEHQPNASSEVLTNWVQKLQGYTHDLNKIEAWAQKLGQHLSTKGWTADTASAITQENLHQLRRFGLSQAELANLDAQGARIVPRLADAAEWSQAFAVPLGRTAVGPGTDGGRDPLPAAYVGPARFDDFVPVDGSRVSWLLENHAFISGLELYIMLKLMALRLTPHNVARLAEHGIVLFDLQLVRFSQRFSTNAMIVMRGRGVLAETLMSRMHTSVVLNGSDEKTTFYFYYNWGIHWKDVEGIHEFPSFFPHQVRPAPSLPAPTPTRLA